MITMAKEIKLREAQLTDTPYINSLFLDHSHKFLSDYDQHEWQNIAFSIQNGIGISIVNENNTPVGFVWFGNEFDDIKANLFFICDPAYLLLLRKQHIYRQLIDKAFFLMPVNKFTCRVHQEQTGVIHLLEKVLRFKEASRHKNETRFHDKLVWVYDYELHRSFWESKRKREKSNGSTENT